MVSREHRYSIYLVLSNIVLWLGVFFVIEGPSKNAAITANVVCACWNVANSLVNIGRLPW